MEIYLLFGVLFGLILLGVQVPIALAASVLITIFIEFPFLDPVIVAQRSVGTIARAWPLLTIPLFIMLGEVFKVGSISTRIVNVANIFVGRFPGGLAVVNILSSYFFGGISGSAAADTSAIGGIMIPMMKKQGYDSKFATIVTITSSCLGPIVPPSILVILIAYVTELPVGMLFVAGYIPAFISMMGLIVLSVVIALNRNYPKQPTPGSREAIAILLDALPVLITPFIIVGAILSGVVTIVESAVVALIWSVLISAFWYREMKWRHLGEILRNTVSTTAFVGVLLAFASAFAWLVTFSGAPGNLAEWLVETQIGVTEYALSSALIFLVLGTFLNPGEIVLMVMPILFPGAIAIGVDPIHFVMISALSMVIGNVTPPVGISLFIGSAISGDRIHELMKPLLPYLAVMIGVVILIILVPDITLWLPKIFGYMP